MKDEKERSFTSLVADRHTLVKNSPTNSYTIARPGDFIVWDAHMTVVVMDPKSYHAVFTNKKPRTGK